MSTIAEQQKIFAQMMHGQEQLPEVFATSNLDVQTGLAVYRNNLKLAWRNALKNTFPVMTQLLGDEGMALLARDYVAAYPSKSGDLNDLGMHLTDFLQDYLPLQHYPYLAEVAALEWRVHCAHSAANHTPLNLADLMAQGADAWLSACVKSAASAHLMRTQTAAARIWHAHQEGGDLSILQTSAAIHQAEFILISRPLWRVEVRVLDEAVYAFLVQLHNGHSFEQALEWLEQHHIELDLTRALPMLIESGVWAHIDFK